MTVEIIEDPAAMAALEPAWTALWRNTPGATPFQSPQWLLPWWSAFGTAELRLATWWQGGRAGGAQAGTQAGTLAGTLAGVLPAYVLPADASGPAKLLPIGAGTTDYLDVLGQGAAPMLHALLARTRATVGRCDLIEVPPDSPLRDVPPPPGWRLERSDGSPCPVLAPLAVPSGMRRNLNLARNRAARQGGFTVTEASPATLPGALDSLVALHQARWTAQDEPGVLADPAVLAFHRAAAPRLLDSGLLRLSLLWLDNAVAAAVLALLDADRIHFYLSGYDRDRRHASPGALLFGAMLDQAAAEGRTEAHFLRGPEPYKYSWGATDRLNATISYIRTGSHRT